MVKNATSYSGSGLRDWLVQRVSGAILGAYVIFWLIYALNQPTVDFAVWQELFANLWVKVFSLLALLSLMLHAWVGIWTIFTDYIKPACIRLSLQVLVILALVLYFIWGFLILWSI